MLFLCVQNYILKSKSKLIDQLKKEIIAHMFSKCHRKLSYIFTVNYYIDPLLSLAFKDYYIFPVLLNCNEPVNALDKVYSIYDALIQHNSAGHENQIFFIKL